MSEGWQPDSYLGQLFEERYRIESCIGRGGMGAIYKATDQQMDRVVAIKLVQRRHAKHEEIIKRFRREMRATTSIEHPNTIRVYEFGVSQDDGLYLIMEFLNGVTLDKVVQREGALAHDRVARIARQVASALSAAHAEGIVHRDLKPENIMLVAKSGQPDFAKVFDFGLARYTDDRKDEAKLTMGDHRVGTPLCMAPEYITKGKVGRRTDLYALGVVAFTMATGRAPFLGTPYEILHKHVKEKPPRPSSLRPDLPEWLEGVILQLLAKHPRDRQANAEVVIAQIEEQRTDYDFDTEATFRTEVPPVEEDDSTASPAPPKQDAPIFNPDAKREDREHTTAVPGADRDQGPVLPKSASASDSLSLPLVPPPPVTTPAAAPRPAWLWPAVIGLLLFIGIVGGSVALVAIRDAPSEARSTARSLPVVAVRPLQPISDDTELRIVADTISRQIGDALLDKARVAVVSAETGAADAYVHGTVAGLESGVKVHLELTDHTGKLLWGNTFELALDEEQISTTSDTVAAEVQAALHP